jgi:hypothetical protein
LIGTPNITPTIRKIRKQEKEKVNADGAPNCVLMKGNFLFFWPEARVTKDKAERFDLFQNTVRARQIRNYHL